MNRPIILDTDPGIDDAVALTVLHHYRADEVRLVVAGYGNIAKEHTVQNALTMCSLLKWDVPVLPASGGPVKGGYETAATFMAPTDWADFSFRRTKRRPFPRTTGFCTVIKRSARQDASIILR